MKTIEKWLLTMGISNLILLLFAVTAFLPKKEKKKRMIKQFMEQRFYLLIIVTVVIIHLVEVNIVDSYATNFVGKDFASIFKSIEGNTIKWFVSQWTPTLIFLFGVIYIIIYPFTLWFSPLLFLVSGEKKAMRSLAYGLLVIYLLALPFYLFLPVTNVYTYYGSTSALNSVVPSIENFFYTTTTHNNCFPSLHVAMILLIAKSASFTNNKRYHYATLVVAVTVILSVIYLFIHWLTDVIGGILVFLIASIVVDWENSVEKEVLRRITPSFKERKALNQAVITLIRRVKEYCAKTRINATPLLVGSVAKDTYLKDSVDIDLFILFPKSIPRETLEKQGLSIGRAILENPEERYAEHPYVRGRFNGFDAEIVPCYRIKKPGEKMSAVDRTPFHTDYVKEHLPVGKKDEVRLLKQFLKGIGCYGAEAEVEGFSGYLCELLIIKYGSFKRLLKATKEWRKGRIVIKIKEVPTPEFFDPLVVIDPVDPKRNVASALSKEKLSLFIHACKEYLQEPKITFFFPRETKPLSLREIEKRLSDMHIIGIEFPKPDIIPDNLYPQIRKSLKAIVVSCEKEGFEVTDFRFVVQNDRIYLLLKVKNVLLSPTVTHRGPPDWEKQHVKMFKEKWSVNKDAVRKPYLKDGRWYVEVKRKYRDLKTFLKDKLPAASLGKDIQNMVMKQGFTVLLLRDLLKEDLRVFWTEYLDERMPWER